MHSIRAPCIKPAINQGWAQLHSNFILINIHWQPGSSDHGPNTNGLITGAFLWSHHDRHHLIMCIFMSTFMCRSWQCWLRHHKSSLTKGPVTSLRFHFVEVPCQDTYLDWRPVDEEQRAQNYDFFCCWWYKIDYYRSGHFRTCIWPCLTVRNTYPLLSLHLIILEYGSDQFKNEVENHDNEAKFTGLSCKPHLFSYRKMSKHNCTCMHFHDFEQFIFFCACIL